TPGAACKQEFAGRLIYGEGSRVDDQTTRRFCLEQFIYSVTANTALPNSDAVECVIVLRFGLRRCRAKAAKCRENDERELSFDSHLDLHSDASVMLRCLTEVTFTRSYATDGQSPACHT